MAFQAGRVEFRASVAVEGSALVGMAHVFGKTADTWGGKEKFAPGAFDAALAKSDVRAFVQHDQSKILGRQSAGTVTLAADAKGLGYRIDLPSTTYANDLKESIARRDVTEMSFGFIPGQFQLSYDTRGVQTRTHTAVKELVDISPVAIAAFGGTSVNLRAAGQEESVRSQAARIRAQVRRSQS